MSSIPSVMLAFDKEPQEVTFTAQEHSELVRVAVLVGGVDDVVIYFTRAQAQELAGAIDVEDKARYYAARAYETGVYDPDTDRESRDGL